MVNRLEIGENGKMILNGNRITIFANEFVCKNNAAIISHENRKANSAKPNTNIGRHGVVPGDPSEAGGEGPMGFSGHPGLFEGVVTIFVNRFEGSLKIDLRGQDGL